MNPLDENPTPEQEQTEPQAERTDETDAQQGVDASEPESVPEPEQEGEVTAADEAAEEATAEVAEETAEEIAPADPVTPADENASLDEIAALERLEAGDEEPAGDADPFAVETPEPNAFVSPEEDSLSPVETQSSDELEAAEPDVATEAATGVAAETAGEPGSDEAVSAETLPGYEENPLMNWFIVHTYSGFENKVSESLKTRAEAFGFAERLGQILIPTEEVVEMRNGKKINSKRLLYPGYVLVQMEMDDDLWHQVKNTPRVTGFVGGGGKPVPLSATEVNSILFRQSTAAERPRPKLSFDKNETVRIVDGPFANFSGKVDEINPERNTLRVMVTIFGRSTPVELDFLQVEKIA